MIAVFSRLRSTQAIAAGVTTAKNAWGCAVMVADWFSVAVGAAGWGPYVSFWTWWLCAVALIPLSVFSIFISVGGFISDWQERKRKQKFDDWLDESIKTCDELIEALSRCRHGR